MKQILKYRWNNDYQSKTRERWFENKSLLDYYLAEFKSLITVISITEKPDPVTGPDPSPATNSSIQCWEWFLHRRKT